MSTIRGFDTDLFENEIAFNEEIANISARCNIAGISIERVDGGFVYDNEYNVGIKQGRGTRDINIYSAAVAKRFGSVSFENYNFIAGYAAIYSRNFDSIESAIRPLNPSGSATLRRRLFKNPSEDITSGETDQISFKSPNQNQKIELSDASEELKTFLQTGLRIAPLSLKLTGFNVSSHESALNTLQRVSDSFLIQLDLISNLSLGLVRERQNRLNGAASNRAYEAVQSMGYPQHEYDHAPVSLYQYGRSAIGMPLLQFLAFYQVVEFYYPTYSDTEARKRVKNLLKDPNFRSDRDADIGRLLSTIQSKSGGLGSERLQLKATIQECVDQRNLKDFILENSARLEFYKSTPRRKGHTKLNVENDKTDILDELANRLYDIRCEIVHTKDNLNEGSERSQLLPYSVEADQLQHDISLMQYVAQRVLIASSRTLL